MKKQQTPFEKETKTLAVLIHDTDAVAKRVLDKNKGNPADETTLKNCVERLNTYTVEHRWEKEYTALKNSIAQGMHAVEAIHETIEKKEADVKSQYVLLDKLKEKIGADPSNRDLIERIEQLQKTITPEKDKTGDIVALQTELEKIAYQRKEELRQSTEQKNLINCLLIMALYEQRLGLCALVAPNTAFWVQFAKELNMPAVPGKERTDIFSLLGKQALAPAARKIYDGLCNIIEEEEPPRDFSKKEDRQAVKSDAVVKLKKIAKLEKLCHEALHEDSTPYKKLMEAQNALIGDGAEEMSLKEMQGKLLNLQKAARDYMVERVDKGDVFGVPRREARLVYAAALHNFAQKFGQQLNEAMRCRDVESLEMPLNMTRDYIKNSLAAMDLMVKEQMGIDLTKEKSAPEKKTVLDNRRQ